MASNEVRIIGGLWKGRKLRFPPTRDLRPTLGRVRETLFNWLGAEVRGAHCLDLFAGSGALGFEALSRGATTVTFVERNRKAAEALHANAARLGATGAHIVTGTAAAFLRRHHDRWDIVFFDPPFAEQKALELLGELRTRALRPGGVIYVERPRRETLPFAEQMHKRGRAGDCHFGLLAALPQHEGAP